MELVSLWPALTSERSKGEVQLTYLTYRTDRDIHQSSWIISLLFVDFSNNPWLFFELQVHGHAGQESVSFYLLIIFQSSWLLSLILFKKIAEAVRMRKQCKDLQQQLTEAFSSRSQLFKMSTVSLFESHYLDVSSHQCHRLIDFSQVS